MLGSSKAGAVARAAAVLTLRLSTLVQGLAQGPAPNPNAGRDQGMIPPPGADPGLNGGRPDRGRGKNRPLRPTPYLPDRRVNLGPSPGERGVWEGNAGATLATNVKAGLDNPSMYLPTNLKIR